MKPYLLLLLIILFIGCEKDTVNNEDNSILLLKIDYLTHEFEAGIELELAQHTLYSDTLPITVDYQPPGDFGNIALYHSPTNEMIFSGGIIWMGTGIISYPTNFISVENFANLSYEITQPDTSMFQTIWNPLSEYENTNYSSIWSAIEDLEIVEEYLSSNMKIGLFLYTPSVGAMDPNVADWFVIMKK